jgi:hypothetical protein
MKTQIEKELLQEIISQLKAFQAGLYFDSKDDVIKRAEKVLNEPKPRKYKTGKEWFNSKEPFMPTSDELIKPSFANPIEGFEIKLIKHFAQQKGTALLMLHPDDFDIIAKRYMKPTEKDNIKKFEEINDKLPNE